MVKKARFTLQDEQRIIHFVKRHEILFNTRHKHFRDSEVKNKLWLKLARTMGREVELVRKKWQTMRDYFVRTKDRKSIDPTVPTTKRDESLAFLLETYIPKKRLTSTLSPNCTETDTQSSFEAIMLDEALEVADGFSNADEQLFAETYSDPNFSWEDPPDSCSQSPKKQTNKQKLSEADKNDILQELMVHINTEFPKPQMPDEDMKNFFHMMSLTTQKFSLTARTRLKIKIAQLVGEEEMAWAENKEYEIGEQPYKKKKETEQGSLYNQKMEQ